MSTTYRTESNGMPIYPETHPEHEYALQDCYQQGMVAAYHHAGAKKPTCPHTFGPYREAWRDGLDEYWAVALGEL